MMHDHHDDRPAQEHDAATRRLSFAIGINVLLSVIQVVGGLLSGSLSLLADALHNFSDAASLVLALLARRIARRPPDSDQTFGYRRAEVVGSLINLTAIMVISMFLVIEALTRTIERPGIDGWPIIIVAAIALAVDLATAGLTHSVAHGGLNLRAAFLHNLADAGASLAVIVSGTLILWRGWWWTDLVATVLIATWIAVAAWPPMRRCIGILMEGTPSDLSLDEVARTIRHVDGVLDVSHLHVWPIHERSVALEVHVRVAEDRPVTEADAIRRRVAEAVERRHGIDHATIVPTGSVTPEHRPSAARLGGTG